MKRISGDWLEERVLSPAPPRKATHLEEHRGSHAPRTPVEVSAECVSAAKRTAETEQLAKNIRTLDTKIRRREKDFAERFARARTALDAELAPLLNELTQLRKDLAKRRT